MPAPSIFLESRQHERIGFLRIAIAPFHLHASWQTIFWNKNDNRYFFFKNTRMESKASHQTNENVVLQTKSPIVCVILKIFEKFHDKRW
jgi:hypothetical protein